MLNEFSIREVAGKAKEHDLDVIAIDVWQGLVLKESLLRPSCEKKGKENGSDSAFADRGARCRLVGRQGDERWGYGVVMDIVLGILGAIVGGWIFGALNIWPGGGIIGGILVAFVGAVLLVWIARQLKKSVVGRNQKEQTAPTVPGKDLPAPFVWGELSWPRSLQQARPNAGPKTIRR